MEAHGRTYNAVRACRAVDDEARETFRALTPPESKQAFRVAAEHGNAAAMLEILHLSDYEACPDDFESQTIMADILRNEAGLFQSDSHGYVAAARVMLENTPVDPSANGSRFLLDAALGCRYNVVDLLIEDGRSDVRSVLRQFRVPAPAPPVTMFSRFSRQLQRMRDYLAAELAD